MVIIFTLFDINYIIISHLFETVGKTSNSAVVMAQLIVDGKNHGMHPFVCLLRDVETHQPLPGNR